ncbi:MAG: fructosamine kinase family protein [Sphingomonadales bacterium]
MPSPLSSLTPLISSAAALLDTTLSNVETLHGGALSAVLAATTEDGRRVVLKDGPAPIVEASMLQALADAGAPVPKVIGANAATLVMDYLPDDSTEAGDLGAVLARLHQMTGPRYGWPNDYAFGSLKIQNTWRDTWPEFWETNRLRPAMAWLPEPLADKIEDVCSRLQTLLPNTPVPALLHGDLWRGNILSHSGQVGALIDPAAFYGHHEADLAMLTLFGGLPARFWDDYGAPPPAERLAVYQLWPACVHVRLFGAGYLPMVERCLKTIGL